VSPLRTTNEKYPIKQMSPNETSTTSVPTWDGAKCYVCFWQNPSAHRPSDGYDENSPTTLNALAMNMLSGPGINDYGDVWFTATTGSFTDPTKTSSAFSTAGESASPGYYQVYLKNWNTNVEVASALHSALARFTFPGGTTPNVVVRIRQTATQSSESAQIQITGNNEIDGYSVAGNWGGNVKVYFCMQFDQPFQTFGTWTNSTVSPGSMTATQSDSSTMVGAYVTFPQNSSGLVVQARIGISYVDANGSKNNGSLALR
jgi:putative alpha-1,2-mannosidase